MMQYKSNQPTSDTFFLMAVADNQSVSLVGCTEAAIKRTFVGLAVIVAIPWSMRYCCTQRQPQTGSKIDLIVSTGTGNALTPSDKAVGFTGTVCL